MGNVILFGIEQTPQDVGDFARLASSGPPVAQDTSAGPGAARNVLITNEFGSSGWIRTSNPPVNRRKQALLPRLAGVCADVRDRASEPINPSPIDDRKHASLCRSLPRLGVSKGQGEIRVNTAGLLALPHLTRARPLFHRHLDALINASATMPSAPYVPSLREDPNLLANASRAAAMSSESAQGARRCPL
jgi:hypothetical protein